MKGVYKMMKYNVAVLGATGAVGQEMLKLLAERNFPINTIKALASAKSAGTKTRFGNDEITIEEATENSFEGMDFVLGAVSNPMAEKFAPAIVRSGAVFVDNSSAFRLKPDVPLVIPEINPEDAFTHSGIVANPNCSTIVALMAISGICKLTNIVSMVASTYQAVSGAGREGIVDLEEHIKAVSYGGDIECMLFLCHILSNCIPMIGSPLDNLYTTEEMKMQNEGRKILHMPEMNVCCTCVRVPVMRSHSVSVQIRTSEPITVEQACVAIANAPGCALAQDINGRNYPTPLDTSDQDLVYVGRVRRDSIYGENGLALWCCGDQIRKGAALNAVQIVELLAAR